MRKTLLLLTLGLLPLLSFAQGCITIFSEDGDRFFLVLNGVQQNTAAQTNVHVDGLMNDYYSAKVIFEDKTKGELSKNVPVKDAGSGQFADMTFKIKKTKDGELKMRFFSSTPVPVAYNPPPDMYVVHYGQPAPQAAAPANTVTQTTSYSTTTTSAQPGMSVNVGAGGMNMNVNVGDAANSMRMNVNVNDPNAAQATSTTTTTTTTSTSYSTTSSSTDVNSGYSAAPAQQAAPAGCGYPMDWQSFNDAKKSISGATFEDTKLSTAKTILSSNCVSTDQVIAICKLFTYEQSKLDFAKFAYSKTTDPGNYFKVGNVFTYDASKTELNSFISGN